MGFLTDWLTDWLRELLVEGILSNLDGTFTKVNDQVGEIATQVGTTPAAWNAGVFAMIKQLSETVILPIAGMVLTFVMCYELINLLIEKNNLHDVDTWMFYKWIFKTFVAIVILTNCWNIVNAVFDVAQSVVQNSAGLIQGSTAVSDSMLNNMEATLQSMSIGALLGLWLQSLFIGFTMNALSIFIFVLCYGRMLEIYALISLAPLPAATVGNREMGHMGNNYFKSLLALGFQGFLMIVCVAIYAVLVQGISTAAASDIIGAVWGVVGYTVLLVFALFKTGTLAKSVFGAH